MAKTSGGVRGGTPGGAKGKNGDSTYKGRIRNVESLSNMKDQRMYKATKEAISRFHSVMGVRERNIKLADLDGPIMGISGKDGIFLNKRYYNKGYKEMVKIEKKDYSSGFITKTNKPQAHTVTHELAHSLWSDSKTGVKHRAAGQEIRKLYKTWSKDKKKSGYGRYAETNVNEFWAETVTKAVHGKTDKYTTAAKNIAKKYKL